MNVTLGSKSIGLPRGAGWLAERAACPVVPVPPPDGADGYSVVIGAPIRPCSGEFAVQAAIQSIIDEAVMPDPSPLARVASAIVDRHSLSRVIKTLARVS